MSAYRWERCRGGECVAIEGATRPRYTVSPADDGFRLRAVVSAATSSAAAPLTPTIASAPRVLARPTIAGRARVGSRLVAKLGGWHGSRVRFVVNWQRCRAGCVQVASGRTYRPTAKDRGARLRVEVIASNALGAVTALSPRTARVS